MKEKRLQSKRYPVLYRSIRVPFKLQSRLNFLRIKVQRCDKRPGRLQFHPWHREGFVMFPYHPRR